MMNPSNQQRVFTDLLNEDLDPNQYDVEGLTAHMVELAGGSHLDSVSDETWAKLVEAHRRAPWPIEVAR